MQLAEFVAFHGPVLEAAPARNNLILGLLEHAQATPDMDLPALESGRTRRQRAVRQARSPEPAEIPRYRASLSGNVMFPPGIRSWGTQLYE